MLYLQFWIYPYHKEQYILDFLIDDFGLNNFLIQNPKFQIKISAAQGLNRKKSTIQHPELARSNRFKMKL
ncbi:MAG: hypothetical protein C6Y22_12680 [Hapalosiphonaceae cyanobacterium JJU2]|nr:MAG: hypothetical protein C6Y22_12680 [Hapalosiphonaceae cyanobacterium JJU2]